jgi:hypothetical protein
MRKAQGALEYLIIIAAVLAIAAIVVLFLTGAFRGASGGGDIAKCRLSAANCASANATGGGSVLGCQTSCLIACANAAGNDVMAPTVVVNAANCPTSGAGTATACTACTQGLANSIHS